MSKPLPYKLSRRKRRITDAVYALFLTGLSLAATLILTPAHAKVPIPPMRDTSLASAMASARMPVGVALAVDAAAIELPKDVPFPRAGASVAEIAEEYGRLPRSFGSVTAVAPPTMVVLGTPPDTPDPYLGMPPGATLKLLASTLTTEEWKSLLSERGLGLADLTDETQQDLFMALFPGGTLKVQWDRPNELNRDEDIQDLSAQIPQARLRLGQHIMLGMPVAGHPNIHSFGMSFRPASAPRQYVQVGGAEVDADYVDGARVRAELPNDVKPGDLNLATPALRVPVPLAGVKTVGQLFLRIGRLCHLEIYADARIERKVLSHTGADAAPADDLLQAVAFCVTGTYRKVGPATVLTDDIVGSGTRRQLWADFEQQAAALRQSALDKAGDAIMAVHKLDDVTAQGDLLAFTPEEVAASYQQHAGELANHIVPSGGMMSVDLPLAKLTPGQQEVAYHTVEFYSRNPEDDRPTVEGKITVQSQIVLQVVLPMLDGPIEMQFDLMDIFRPSMAVIDKQITQADDQGRKYQTEWEEQRKNAARLSLPELLKGSARRAVLAAPKTAAEADTLVTSAKALGLNEIWIDAFSGGTAHLDALNEALKTTGSGDIQVFAVMDLLSWGADAPSAAIDRTLLGKTSAADANRREQDRQAKAARRGWGSGISPRNAARPVSVSPFSSLVRQRLTSLIQDVSARPGLAGLVWRDTVSAGYLPEGHMIILGAPAALGYGESGRLAFLRKAHADPVDLSPSEYRQGHADTRLPCFDDQDLDRSLPKRWKQFRIAQNVDFLHFLYGAVTPGRVLVIGARGPANQESELGPQWYGTWNGSGNPPTDREEFGAGEAWQDERTQAANQSKLAFYPLHVPPVPVPVEFQYEMLVDLKQSLHNAFGPQVKKPWDGYLLDVTPRETSQRAGVSPAADPLAILVNSSAKDSSPAKP